MAQDATDTDLDLRKVMKFIAHLNPHVSLADIAFLMDVPYEPEPFEIKSTGTAETF